MGTCGWVGGDAGSMEKMSVCEREVWEMKGVLKEGRGSWRSSERWFGAMKVGS